MTVRIIEGHCLDVLARLEPESVDMVWTSVPYWGLRSFGVAPQDWGGWRGEHGCEPSLDLWIQNELTIFRAVWRVLKRDGTVWLNIGDAYASQPNGRSAAAGRAKGRDDRTFRDKPISTADSGLAGKQRLMLPARLALALQGDGWFLRDEIVWHKTNCMPSSVKDRTAPAHEMIYLLARQPHYVFDGAAIAEPASPNTHARIAKSGVRKGFSLKTVGSSFKKNNVAFQAAMGTGVVETRMKRSVWSLPTEPFPDAHFATAPTALVAPCILAGCPIGGTVLDPFGGAGTTGLVAAALGRNAILIELNPDYARMARERIAGGGMKGRAA